MSDIKMNKQLGTKWFTFYTKVRPWIACLTVFIVIGDFLQYTDVYVSNWWMLLYLAVAIAQPILCIVVAVKSSGDYVDFVRFVKGVLLFETIYISYQQGVQQYIKSEMKIGFALITFAIVFVISYFIWYRLNVKYFEKRILTTSSFQTEFSTDFPQNPYVNNPIELNPVTEKICFCRKCGVNLIDGSCFCHNCGTQIIKEPAVTVSERENWIFCKKCGADITNDTDTCHVCGEQKGTD